MKDNNPKIVVIGGGTGSFSLLSGLKNHTKNLTALVNMSDDGGSTGILRDEFGVLPPGDVRQCLVALSESTKLRDLFNYRFEEGSFKGHSFGNIFLSTVEKMTDSFEDAVQLAGEILHTKGTVIPVTTTNSKLVLKQQDGETIRGQFTIGNLHFAGKTKPEIYLEPESMLTNKGKQALLDADLIVIAPGNLYGSLAPALVVNGVKNSLVNTKAKIVYVCNLVTKPNQTDGFMVHDYASEITRFIGADVLDFVIYNTDEPPANLIDKYMHEGEKIVEFDLDILAKQKYRAIGLPLISKHSSIVNKADKIANVRSLIRHDQTSVAKELLEILNY